MSPLRTLMIAQNLPYPTFSGMDLRNWQNIQGLRSVGEVGVFGLQSNDPRNAAAPPTAVAFWRASADPALAYPPPNQKLAARAWLLDPQGHPADLYYSEGAAAEMSDLLTAFRPHAVVIEGLWLHRYIPLLRSHECQLVLDLHAVEAAMFEEIGDSTPGGDLKAKLFRNILPDRVKAIERRATHAVDQIWVCSLEDARLLEELDQPSAPIQVVPNAVDIESYERLHWCPESLAPNRRTFIFPAIFQWGPNAAAAKFLIDEVFPRLAGIYPDCRLLLAGGGATPAMLDAARREPRIVVTGVVPDMLPFLAAASVMLVPVMQGGGTRFKILEAFAANVPVISTRKGAEGLAVENGKHLLLAESVEEFVEAVKRIWTDEGLAKRLAVNGLELVTEAYSWNVSSRRILQAVAALEGRA